MLKNFDSVQFKMVDVINARVASFLLTTTVILCVLVLYMPLGCDSFWLRHGSRYDSSKRTSGIACPCCAHSFNTRCCLDCIHRVGKRSEQQLPDNNFAAFPDEPAGEENEETSLSLYSELEPQEAKILATEIQTYHESKALACQCCTHLLHSFPRNENTWPCCGLCLRQKRSVNSELVDAKKEDEK